MKLTEALDIAEDCGLTTVSEAILNIDMHAMSIFSYAEMGQELNELFSGYNELYNAGAITKDTPIDEVRKLLSEKDGGSCERTESTV